MWSLAWGVRRRRVRVRGREGVDEVKVGEG